VYSLIVSLGVGGDGVFLSPSGGHGNVSLSLSLLILEIVDCCFVYSLLLSLLVAVARKYKPTQEDVESISNLLMLQSRARGMLILD